MKKSTVAASAVVCLTALGWQGTVHAAPCKDLPNPVIVAGSTAVGALLGKVAAKLNAASGDDKITIVLAQNPNGSCRGVETLGADVTPTGACVAGACASGTANAYDSSGKATVACELDATAPHIDLVLSDVYKESCPGETAKNPNLRDESLLVLPFGFIVPTASTQNAIDAKEAYYVFGRGGTANVTPWVNNDFILRRNNGSGTQITIYKNLNIPINAPGGIDKMSTGGVRDGVKDATNAQAAIGIIGLDQSDGYRSVVKSLAYRHFGQQKFYYADSTPNAYDKKNVRDGHYPLWGYEHGIYLVDGSGNPINPRAKKLVDILSGKLPLPGGDMVVENAQAGTIPTCAMEVERTADGKDYTASTGESCGCLYEKSVVQGSTSCTSCTSDANCASGQKCHHNYCEAR
ncbi:MAG TPA: hypothetical protein VI299_26945 [Polyangiales bacterium]